ncbi:MAG: RNA polymerase sigma factor [Eubacteriales bacterium]|nr:RNA polymerase sigma factor [Eubacteriales bacterium]
MIESLYSRLFEELALWCAGMTEDRGAAEEIVQEAFLRAMAHEADLEPLAPEQRRAWLYRTVKNLFLDRKRRARLLVSLEQMQQSGFEPAALMQELGESEWNALLEALPPPEGMLFALRYLEGYTSSQLGQMFSMPAATVRSRLASARKRLREMIGG